MSHSYSQDKIDRRWDALGEILKWYAVIIGCFLVVILGNLTWTGLVWAGFGLEMIGVLGFVRACWMWWKVR